MTMRFRRPMLVLGTTVLVLQALFMPIGMVNAETMTSQATQNESLLETTASDEVTNESKYSIIDESLAYNDKETTVNEELPTDDANDLVVTESSTIGGSKESEIQNKKIDENLTFSIEGEKIVHTESNHPFTITVKTNQEIDKFRLILPSDASFFIEDTEKTKVQDLADGSIIWLIDANAISSNFDIELTYIESGQFSVEDETGGVHADFIHVEIEKQNSKISDSRISLTVSTWALFAAGWNNSAYTSLALSSSISAGTASLNSRSTSITIASATGAVFSISGSNTILQFSSNLQITSAQMSSFILRGTGTASNLIIANTSRLATPNNSINQVGGTVTIKSSLDSTTTQPNLDNNGTLTISNLNLETGWVRTNTNPIKANAVILGVNNASFSGSFRINNRISNQPVLDTENLRRIIPSAATSTIRSLAFWDLGTDIAVNSLASRFWSELSFQVANNDIISSSQPTFTNNNFQISNTRQISTLNLVNSSNLPPAPEDDKEGIVNVEYITETGEILDQAILVGKIGEEYNTEVKYFNGYELIDVPSNSTGYFLEKEQIVTYIYSLKEVLPVDPLDPEVEINPENKPELPEDQGQLSIDFVSSFNFGSQAISVHDQTYYAQPQRLLNEDGTVNDSEERPNYVQISDRRSENDRNGWILAVTQKEQFKGAENQVLNGASLSLSNQQVITAQGGEAPGLQSVPCTLVPGNRRTLLQAQGSEGTGTWIYRFGDGETASESVALYVPKGTNPEATTYSSTLIWELSAVPGN